MIEQEYYIAGDTYQIKDDLGANKCQWRPERKAWKTPKIAKESLTYKRLKGLADAVGAKMYPVNLTGEAKAIQDILNKGTKR